MSARVVRIDGSPCTRRKNYAQDGDAIRLRRMLEIAEAAAFVDNRTDTLDDRSTALAMSWEIKDRLPCSRLRVLAGTLDQRQDFELRLAEVEIARAERKVFAGKIARTRILYGQDAANELFPENDRIFDRYRQAMLDMANTAALTRRDLERKRKAIGGVWMGAEGAWYDQLRAAVAADEERLVRGAP